MSQVTYLDGLVPTTESGWCDFNNYATSLSNIIEHQPVVSQEYNSEQSLSSVVKDTSKCSKRTLTGERIYFCNQCGSSFTNSSNLKSHLRIHSGERPYICDICGASFVQSSNMKAHKRTHTGERPYECKECNQSFSRSSHLTGHMRTHTGEKPYICGICDDSFVTSTHLRNHMKKHTGERPFICNECGASFVLNNILQVHMRIHTGERPFKCGICNSAFRSKGDLRGHYRLHTEERPFTCTRCYKLFKTKQYLKKHMKYCGAPPTGKRRGRPKKNNIDENIPFVEPVDISNQNRPKNEFKPIKQSIKARIHKDSSDCIGIKGKKNKNNQLGKIDNDKLYHAEQESDIPIIDLSGFQTPETIILKSDIMSQVNNSIEIHQKHCHYEQ